MVLKDRVVLLLALGAVLSLVALNYLGDPPRDRFVGLCVYSSGSFSVLTNGTHDVTLGEDLEEGKVYLVEGRLYGSGKRIKASRIVESEPDFPQERVEGYYWSWPSGSCLILPDRIRLSRCLDVPKGSKVILSGLSYGEKFYPLEWTSEGVPTAPSDGLPWLVEGVVYSGGSKPCLWNGTDEISLYLPYGVTLHPGERVRVLGIAKFYSKISLIVNSGDDVESMGYPESVPLQEAETGEIGEGECYVLSSGKRSLKLDCHNLPLYGFKARVGDRIHVRALVRRGSLLCIECAVKEPREKLENSICDKNAYPAKISGMVEWVKVYGNGFGIANVSKGNCWVLLKLKKSLGLTLHEGKNVTAYGIFTTYRGMEAFEVSSGDDVCSGNC